MTDKICKRHQVNFEDNPEFFTTVVDYHYYNKVRIKKILRTRCILCRRIGDEKYRKGKGASKNRRPYFRVYEKERRKTDVIWKIKKNLRHRVWSALKGLSKSDKTLELLGCRVEKLKKHLENKFEDGMNWDNYGVWHIDHIIGCANFDLSDPEQQKICFHYTNLQPMWGEKNIQKGSRLI